MFDPIGGERERAAYGRAASCGGAAEDGFGAVPDGLAGEFQFEGADRYRISPVQGFVLDRFAV